MAFFISQHSFFSYHAIDHDINQMTILVKFEHWLTREMCNHQQVVYEIDLL